MAVGPDDRPELVAVPGVRLGTAAAGFKDPDREDLLLVALAPGSRTAAVFTRNRLRAAPVLVAEENLAAAAPRALLVNSGNANAATGQPGLEVARESCRLVAEALEVEADAVLPFSTGVIGEPLPLEPFDGALPVCVSRLREEPEAWWAAAEAIGTTDTRLKGASRSLELAGTPVHITGIAKGSGMIHPNMATMLAFVALDAPVADEGLRVMLETAVGESFNRISVDGDTSTNDALTLTATGQAPMAPVESVTDPRYRELTEGVTEVCRELALAIVRDGEGATKLLTIRVSGADSDAEAEAVADRVARSPLVKTAAYASDPNWGRILAAAGAAAPEDLDWSRVTLHIGEVCVVRGGVRAAEYTEEAGQAAMAPEEVTVHLDLGRGRGSALRWTCDFSHEYVTINAEYRT
ncbi:MAG: bifunctional glutamate N-acetyltransferase/amino-acid acetyltransferase ArgJ [Thiohalorhabdus sp.]|uniref:bifunctional glutamate N-acetyltransferase/amino-acid acetyltransferase ArgJ n=1 Tax=Thiohalorhabdus sp. TaxID=3094134 RepID=UPI00397EFAB6